VPTASRRGGCLLLGALNFDPTADYDNRLCKFAKRGCTDRAAPNYESHAHIDDGSCVRLGCTQPGAPNYDATANTYDGSCRRVPETNLHVPSKVLAEACDAATNATSTALSPILAATANTAIKWCNEVFGPAPSRREGNRKLQDGGLCSSSSLEIISRFSNATDITCGCTLTSADNYNALATLDDGGCAITGCMNSVAVDYDSSANIAGNCTMHRMGCTIESATTYDPLATQLDLSQCSWMRSGCMDSNAVNHDPTAQVDNGSCEAVIQGCMDIQATNYNSAANRNADCEYGPYPGCTDSGAINYVSWAGVEDNSCVFPVHGCMAHGTLPNIASNYNPAATVHDSSCTFTRVGCTDPSAFNYDPLADTSDDLNYACVPKVVGCTDSVATTFNSHANVMDASQCSWPSSGCMDSTADNYASGATNTDGSCVHAGCTNSRAYNYDASANFDDGRCDVPALGCTISRAENYQPRAIVDDGTCVIAGCRDSNHPDYDPTATVNSGCRPAGCMNPAATNYAAAAVVDDGSCRTAGCMDSTALNFDNTSTHHSGACQYPELGCMESSASNYRPYAHAPDPAEPCTYGGCMNSNDDLHYNPSATFDDGSCNLFAYGCTDTRAPEYNAAATENDGSCTIVGCTRSLSPFYDPSANVQDDGVCPQLVGCTNPAADNFDSTYTTDDGSCVIFGCTDSTLPGYSAQATTDDGSCGFWTVGCMDSRAENYHEAHDKDGLCVFYGCMDSASLSFDQSATVHTVASCSYPTPGCTNPEANNYASEAAEDNGSCEIPGCTDPLAPNFNSSATVPDGSCSAVIYGCTDSKADNFLSAANREDSSNPCLFTGCTHSAADNYDEQADFESGNCSFPPPSPPPTTPPAMPLVPPVQSPSPAPPPPSQPVALSPLPYSEGDVRAVVHIDGTQSQLAISATDQFGSAVAALGDISGDGTADMVVGAEATNELGVREKAAVGAIHILGLSPGAAVLSATMISSSSGNGFNENLGAFSYFGSAVVKIGDLNNDGCPELAVGARGEDNGASDTGAVYVLFLQPNADGSGCDLGGSLRVTRYEKLLPLGLEAHDAFGSSLAASGDLNGDGVVDVVAGAPGSSLAASATGKIILMALNADGTLQSSRLLAPLSWASIGPALSAQARFGAAIAMHPEAASSPSRIRSRSRRLSENPSLTLAVGAPGENMVYVLALSGEAGSLPSLGSYSQFGPPSSEVIPKDFGQAVAYAADYDGNGEAELVIGAPGSAGDTGTVLIYYLDSGGMSVLSHSTTQVCGMLSCSNVTNFGRAIASLGALNSEDIVNDLAVGSASDYPAAATGAVSVLFLDPITPSPSPPMPPPAVIEGAGASALSESGLQSAVLVGAWVVLPILFCLLGTWSVYFFCYRGHSFKDLYKTNYLLGPAETTLSAMRQGRVSRSLRLEIRGSADAKRARSVRATEPGSMFAAKQSGPRGNEGTGGAGPVLDPDVLLNVCYAPNVPRSGSDPSLSAPRRTSGSGEVSPRTPGGTRIVDLSEATDVLLRSSGEQEPMSIGYEPNYAYNVPSQGDQPYGNGGGSRGSAPAASPRRSSGPIGGLEAVVEEDRVGTWGQGTWGQGTWGHEDGNSSQATWITEAQQQSQQGTQPPVPPLLPGVVPREPGAEAPTIPSPRDGPGFMLRI